MEGRVTSVQVRETLSNALYCLTSFDRAKLRCWHESWMKVKATDVGYPQGRSWLTALRSDSIPIMDILLFW